MSCLLGLTRRNECMDCLCLKGHMCILDWSITRQTKYGTLKKKISKFGWSLYFIFYLPWDVGEVMCNSPNSLLSAFCMGTTVSRPNMELSHHLFPPYRAPTPAFALHISLHGLSHRYACSKCLCTQIRNAHSNTELIRYYSHTKASPAPRLGHRSSGPILYHLFPLFQAEGQWPCFRITVAGFVSVYWKQGCIVDMGEVMKLTVIMREEGDDFKTNPVITKICFPVSIEVGEAHMEQHHREGSLTQPLLRELVCFWHVNWVEPKWRTYRMIEKQCWGAGNGFWPAPAAPT